MLFKILLNYLFGYINITVEGFFVERFINNCINNKVLLWKINKKNTTLLNANVSINDFKKIHEISRRTKCKVKINSKKGLPIILHKYRKRKLIFILFIPIILLIIISSRFIWNIEINGIQKVNKEELLLQLQEEGVKIGNKKSKVNSKNAINNIRLKRNDISWMSIDMKGTNIVITIVEAEAKPDIINDEESCNIVSKQRGMITKITADTGTAIAKVGDIVENGDILIAGYMEGKYTDKRYVHAKGKIQAKVWYTKKIKSGTTRELTQKTGIEKNRYSINFNNFKINLYKTLPKFENYDTINVSKKMKLFSDFYLPIELSKTTYIEETKTNVTYGKEELKEILIEELEKQFINDGTNKLNVVNKIVNVYEKENNLMELEMTYEVMTSIGTEEKINF